MTTCPAHPDVRRYAEDAGREASVDSYSLRSRAYFHFISRMPADLREDLCGHPLCHSTVILPHGERLRVTRREMWGRILAEMTEGGLQRVYELVQKTCKELEKYDKFDEVRVSKLVDRVFEWQCEGCGIIALKKCAGCKKAYYCSRVCQEKDWSSHKLNCKK
jgi:MYND finger protein